MVKQRPFVVTFVVKSVAWSGDDMAGADLEKASDPGCMGEPRARRTPVVCPRADKAALN